MRTIERVANWNVEELSKVEYDQLISCVGYEERARHVAEKLRPNAKSRIAIGFTEQRSVSFADNLHWFLENDFNVDEVSDSNFNSACREALLAIKPVAGRPVRICVDISSLTRFRIASIFAAISEFEHDVVIVDFVYSVAQYVPPIVEMVEIVRAGPVIPQLAGWSQEPDRPSAAIVGLGYERDKAIGALEYIEPAEVWAFQAVSRDERYDRDAQKANFLLWQVLPEQRRIRYRVDKPMDCFIDLESLTYGVLQYSRPLLIPFGPKIFALCCILVGNIHAPRVGVWRVTAGENEPAIERKADGKVVGLRVQFGTSLEEEPTEEGGRPPVNVN